jgi:uncharacterized protein
MVSLIDGFGAQNAVVKVAAFFGVWGVLWLPISVPLARHLHWHPPQPLDITQKIPLVLSLYAIAPAILWGVIQIEGSTGVKYGMHWNLPQALALLGGIGIAVLGVGLLVGVEWALGWTTWQSENLPQFWSALLPTLGLGLVISAVEEPVFRGFVFTQMHQDYGWAIAALASSVIFALSHLVWDGKSAAPQLPGLCVMGGVLVVARQVAGDSLGLACGLHAGWVWAIASLDTAQILTPTQRGPEWMTGIAGQPLAGALGLGLLTLTGIALILASYS